MGVSLGTRLRISRDYKSPRPVACSLTVVRRTSTMRGVLICVLTLSLCCCSVVEATLIETADAPIVETKYGKVSPPWQSRFDSITDALNLHDILCNLLSYVRAGERKIHRAVTGNCTYRSINK